MSKGGGLHLLPKRDGGGHWRVNYRLGGKQKMLAPGVHLTVGNCLSCQLNASGSKNESRPDGALDPPPISADLSQKAFADTAHAQEADCTH